MIVMNLTNLLNSLHVDLNELPSIDGECFVPYAKVFCDGSFEIIVSWNMKQDCFTIAIIDNQWSIRVEQISNNHYYQSLRIIQNWISKRLVPEFINYKFEVKNSND